MPNRTLAALPLALAVIGLAACSAEAGSTVSGESLADLAEDALEDETGARPEIDCGDDSIIISQDKEVDCVATSAETGDEYDTTVTFTSVDGTDYEISVQVADTPSGAAADAPESDPVEEETSEPPADGAQLQIEAPRLAEAAADALEAQIGSRPEIDCGELSLTIFEGMQASCLLIDSSAGAEYDVTITVTAIDGEQFEFDVEVADTPN